MNYDIGDVQVNHGHKDFESDMGNGIACSDKTTE